jgi:hypothetical protein
MIYRAILAFGLSAAALGVLTAEASACPRDRAMTGVVQRVVGQRTDVFIQRAGVERFRPAPMEVLCEGDVVIASATGATVTYRLDGAATSNLIHGPSQIELPRSPRRASVIDNALQILLDNWMPEIRRTSNFGVVRGREEGPPRWETAGLSDGIATIKRGNRPLLLRWSGATAAYRVEVARADGPVLEKATTNKTEVRLPARNWSNGTYVVRVYQGQGKTAVLQGRFRAGDAPPPNADPFPDTIGEEIRVASEALRIARIDSDRWSFEAVQMINAAPVQGLDREAIYRSIDGLSAD